MNISFPCIEISLMTNICASAGDHLPSLPKDLGHQHTSTILCPSLRIGYQGFGPSLHMSIAGDR